MKKLLMAFVVLTLATGVATADTYIGMYAAPTATECYAGTSVYTATTVYFTAWVDTDWSGEISAAEFYVENFPEAAGMGVITENWNTDLVIGVISYGIALAFNPPLSGPLAALGSVDFFTTDANWIPADYSMYVRPSRASNGLLLVDTDGIEYQVGGGMFTFNCSNPTNCDCLEGVATDDANWSSVKALY
ncbi:MAG: hypothetical protein R3C71_03325 [Candidatus Krumholzibacteriia bacterium]|nr:hypothetical protein [bacterium]MCB9514802.1 hypothetical protein [Candidatus Latescibacterota bacterium]